MKRAILFVLLSCSTAYAADAGVSISSDDLGLTAAAVSATPTTKSIDMEGAVSGTTRVTNQLSLTLSVAAGTSTTILVRCYESANNSAWGQIGFCDTVMPNSTCKPDNRVFTLTDYATVGGKKGIQTRWAVKQRYAKCSVYGAGTGTVTAIGTRSWQ